MIIDFQHHYTPPQLLQGKKNEVSVGVDKNGNPMHLLNPLLGDIDAHVRMMDAAGIDAAVLSSMVGFDQPDLRICRTIKTFQPKPCHRARRGLRSPSQTWLSRKSASRITELLTRRNSNGP